MIALLQSERHQHQVKVAELMAILDTERIETNLFLKDMQKILIDLERQRPPYDAFSAPAWMPWNIHNRNVRNSISIQMGRSLNVY